MMALGYSVLKRYGTVSGEYPASTLPVTKSTGLERSDLENRDDPNGNYYPEKV